MKRGAVVLVCLFMPFFVSAQARQGSASPQGRTAEQRIVENKIRQAWEDIKNKNKAGFASILSEDFIAVEEDGKPQDKSGDVAELDALESLSYTLGELHFRTIGSDGVLVRYSIDYAAKMGGESLHNNSAIVEVWQKQNGEWKIVYLQATPIK